MSVRLTGRNPLSYLGVEPATPPNMFMESIPPTSSDSRNVNVGDFWVDKTTSSLYVLTSLAGGTATWMIIETSSGGASINQINADTGSALPIANVVNLNGDTTHITTSASGNSISITLDVNPLEVQNLKIDGQIDGVLQADASGNITATNGTNGQLLIAGTGGPQWASLTAGSNISIVPGSHSITISASGSGGGGAVDFITDIAGPATELGGNITMAGGNNITTDGSTPNTVTFDLTGTTNHAVQVGNSSGSLTSLSVGTNGQVLLGSTGANPTFATLTSGDGSITFTPGAGSLSLQAVGGGGAGGVIITTFNAAGSPHTWTKNIDTSYVTVYGWSAGGGGGSGNLTAAGVTSQGGGGGGNGAVFKFSGPASFFGATETVIVGSGGVGGSAISTPSTQGQDGTNGGRTSFGLIAPPLFTAAQPISGGSLQGGGGGGSISMGSGGSPGGIFIDGQPSRPFFASSAPQSTVGVAVIGFGSSIQGTQGGGGAGSIAVGRDGAYAGGNGSPFNAWNGITPTCGGQGGSASVTNVYFNGGAGGDIFSLDGLSTLIAGGVFGNASGSLPGGNGNPAPTSGGMVFGGTGAGGGAANALTGGNGGTGGFPGGGGGGGGAARNGGTSGAGGTGGDGFVIVIEWT